MVGFELDDFEVDMESALKIFKPARQTKITAAIVAETKMAATRLPCN
jgi:hypothetical protein